MNIVVDAGLVLAIILLLALAVRDAVRYDNPFITPADRAARQAHRAQKRIGVRR